MQHYGLTLAPGVLFIYVKRTLLMMLGKLSSDDGFQRNADGLWQAIWASLIFTFLVSLYPGIKTGLVLLFANLIMQMVAVLVMVLLFITVLRVMRLETQIFSFIVPFLWIENVQHLVAGILQNFVIVSGNPPLLDIITPHPLLDASRLVLPNGSFHLEHTTAILVFSKLDKTSLCFLNPSIFKFL